jgi:uncharacterized protein
MINDANKLILSVAWDGDLVAVRELLSGGIDVNIRDNDGGTALIAAAMVSDPAMVRLLLEFGADVNAQSDDQCTSLHMAAFQGSLEVVETAGRARPRS